MNELSITYQGVPAHLKRASRPGYWAVWADNTDDGPTIQSNWGRNLAVPFDTVHGSAAARYWPEHAKKILSYPDSSG